jgi:hypothetical protein
MHLSIFAWKAFSCCCFIIWRRKWQSIHAMAFPPWTDAPTDWILECAGHITAWRMRETLPGAGASRAGLSSPICTCTACVPTGTGCLHCGCMSPRAGAESPQIWNWYAAAYRRHGHAWVERRAPKRATQNDDAPDYAQPLRT